MHRPFALAFFLALVACGSPVSPSDGAYEQALLDGDSVRALDILDARADDGDIQALSQLATIHKRGYIRRPSTDSSDPMRYLRVVSLPGQAAWAHRRYERELTKQARLGSPDALLLVAEKLAGPYVYEAGARRPVTTADQDSARALYTRLVPADVSRVRLALVAKNLGDEDAFAYHIDEAVDAGEPQGCMFKIWFVGPKRDRSTVAGLAAFYEDAEACPSPPDAPDVVGEDIRQLVAQIELGNEDASLFLDSLRAEGVFERHPRLEAFVTGRATERG